MSTDIAALIEKYSAPQAPAAAHDDGRQAPSATAECFEQMVALCVDEWADSRGCSHSQPSSCLQCIDMFSDHGGRAVVRCAYAEGLRPREMARIAARTVGLEQPHMPALLELFYEICSTREMTLAELSSFADELASRYGASPCTEDVRAAWRSDVLRPPPTAEALVASCALAASKVAARAKSEAALRLPDPAQTWLMGGGSDVIETATPPTTPVSTQHECVALMRALVAPSPSDGDQHSAANAETVDIRHFLASHSACEVATVSTDAARRRDAVQLNFEAPAGGETAPEGEGVAAAAASSWKMPWARSTFPRLLRLSLAGPPSVPGWAESHHVFGQSYLRVHSLSTDQCVRTDPIVDIAGECTFEACLVLRSPYDLIEVQLVHDGWQDEVVDAAAPPTAAGDGDGDDNDNKADDATPPLPPPPQRTRTRSPMSRVAAARVLDPVADAMATSSGDKKVSFVIKLQSSPHYILRFDCAADWSVDPRKAVAAFNGYPKPLRATIIGVSNIVDCAGAVRVALRAGSAASDKTVAAEVRTGEAIIDAEVNVSVLAEWEVVVFTAYASAGAGGDDDDGEVLGRARLPLDDATISGNEIALPLLDRQGACKGLLRAAVGWGGPLEGSA